MLRQPERYRLGGGLQVGQSQIDKRVFFVTYTLRAEVIRIISARRANQREVKRYENQT